MLKHAKVFGSFSTDNVENAHKFYSETLGLDVGKDAMGGLELHLANGHRVYIYPKPDHQPATFTVLNFMVPDIEKTVNDLTNKGVKFEHYHTDHIQTDSKGISRGNGPNIAWFRDNAGNYLSLIESK